MILATILVLIPYSINEIIEFNDIPFLENVKHELNTVQGPIQPVIFSSISEKINQDENNKKINEKFNQGISKLELPFIKNEGQINSEQVKYYANTFAGTVFVTNIGLTYSIPDPYAKDGKHSANMTISVIQEEFTNANQLHITGSQKSSTGVSYFIGNNSKDWHKDIPTYNVVSLGTLWPGINLDLKAHGNNVEKIFTLNPGANVHDINIGIHGISKIKPSDGNIWIYTGKGIISMSKPIAYQMIHDVTKKVDVSYVISGKTYGFMLGKYDKSYPVVIDPIIQSTYLGGSGDDNGYAITFNSTNGVYVTGQTSSTNFPGKSGGAQTTLGSNPDVFVSKLNSTLTSLTQSTYLGGTGSDIGYGIVDDRSSNIYVIGKTGSTDFPGISGGAQTTLGSNPDVFVSKLNSALTTLTKSTYLGGSSDDEGYGIALDTSGIVYVTGKTASTDFPGTSGGAQTTYGGSTFDVFVSKLNSALTTLTKSTYLGGSGTEFGNGITIDGDGNVYVTGRTSSTNFPGTSGGAQTSNGGGNNDAFVSKLNSALTTLTKSTYLGGSGDDTGRGIALDSLHNVYVIGQTSSTDFPGTSGGAQTSNGGGNNDAFVSKLNSALTSLTQSTYLGGSADEDGKGIALDSSDNVYVIGITHSTNFPGTSGGAQTTYGGSIDAFVSKLNSALTTLTKSTYLGGSDVDQGYGIALDGLGNVYVIGETSSTNFPGKSGGAQTTYGGGTWDAFVSYLDCNLSSTGSACTVTTTTVTAGVSVTKTLPAAGKLEVTLPSTNKVSFTLPSGISGDVTVVTSNSGSSAASITFLGTVVDFTTTSCTGGCIVAFNFTQAQLTASGFTSSQIKVFHDSSGDGSFQTSEALTTTISTFSGGFTATASTPSTSKFAIGGVAGSVTANAAAGIGAAGSFLGLLKDNCDESGFGNGKSLRIYEISYDKCDANQITILADTTCGPMNVRVEKESSMNLAGISSDQPHLHDEKRMIVLSSPITSDVMDFSIIAKDKRDEFYEKIYADQCTGTKQYTFTTGYTSEQSNAASPLLPDWIKNNAKWWSSGEIDDDTFVNGIQYLVKHNVITVEKNTSTENTDDAIPGWIKNNAKWWSSGEIDDDTFVNGIQYLVKVGAIKVN